MMIMLILDLMILTTPSNFPYTEGELSYSLFQFSIFNS